MNILKQKENNQVSSDGLVKPANVEDITASNVYKCNSCVEVWYDDKITVCPRCGSKDFSIFDKQAYEQKLKREFAELCTKARQGDMDDQYWLGRCYEEGKGVRQDYVKAFKWYRKAAKQWHLPAIGCLIYYYDEGLGVKQNLKKATKWYRKVAKRGDADILDALLSPPLRFVPQKEESVYDGKRTFSGFSF